jgi:hypothetical protein
MPDPWVPNPDPYVDSVDPIALKPQTYARHARAVNRVLGDNQARYPRAGRGRTTSPSAGCWAKLASGATISGGSGLSLGTGTVVLCSRSGSALTADGATITVYNANGSITATGGDQAVLLKWTDGVWAAQKCG